MDLKLEAVSTDSVDALAMMAQLSARLAEITGDAGRNSFADWREGDAGHVFVVAYDGGVAIGCGGLRALGGGVGEVKRMYAARPGVGSAVLAHLEGLARAMGLERLVLETRAVNVDAVRFYAKRGYGRIENYGRYVGRSEAVCFGKGLDLGAAKAPSPGARAPTSPPRER